MNTGMSNGEPLNEAAEQWIGFCNGVPEIPVGGLIACDAGAAVNVMDVIAYDAPFPDNTYKAGVRKFPQMIPTDANDEAVRYGLRAIDYWSNDWDGESFMAIGMKDAILGEPAMMALKGVIKGARSIPRLTATIFIHSPAARIRIIAVILSKKLVCSSSYMGVKGVIDTPDRVP